jgi:predicted phosphate transport protein (TIGR00153 family)
MKALAALFGRSPFKAVQAHMEKARACVERVPALLQATADDNAADFDRLYCEIYDLESEADAIKNDIRGHLPKSIFLPIDRGDLLEIVDIIDSVADRCQDIGSLLTLKKLKMPAKLKDALDQLVVESCKVCFQAADIVQELDELVETSFGGNEAEKVLGMIEKVNADETVADGAELAAAKTLFSLEEELGAVEIMIWMRIIGKLGDLADVSERMANRLRLLIAK